jgi:hypothetical protein
MGRLARIQSVTSAILKETSHLVIFSRKGGPFYSVHDWPPNIHGTPGDRQNGPAQVVQPPSWRQPIPSPKLFLVPHGQTALPLSRPTCLTAGEVSRFISWFFTSLFVFPTVEFPSPFPSPLHFVVHSTDYSPRQRHASQERIGSQKRS